MECDELIKILVQAGKLKQETRHCFIDKTRKESVADHSWRTALMAFLLKNEFPEVNSEKVISMCLIHDLGESFTGDIPTFEKEEKESEIEEEFFLNWVQSFPQAIKEEWMSLLDEMKEQKTKEAKLYKALDKLEAIISHNESDVNTWLDLEYDLQYSYGKKECSFSDYFIELHETIDRWTDDKIRNKT